MIVAAWIVKMEKRVAEEMLRFRCGYQHWGLGTAVAIVMVDDHGQGHDHDGDSDSDSDSDCDSDSDIRKMDYQGNIAVTVAVQPTRRHLCFDIGGPLYGYARTERVRRSSTIEQSRQVSQFLGSSPSTRSRPSRIRPADAVTPARNEPLNPAFTSGLAIVGLSADHLDKSSVIRYSHRHCYSCSYRDLHALQIRRHLCRT